MSWRKKGFWKIFEKNCNSFVNYFQVMVLTGIWFLCLFACFLDTCMARNKLSVYLEPKLNSPEDHLRVRRLQKELNNNPAEPGGY